jgi:hypothetical protein
MNTCPTCSSDEIQKQILLKASELAMVMMESWIEDREREAVAEARAAILSRGGFAFKEPVEQVDPEEDDYLAPVAVPVDNQPWAPSPAPF